MTPVDTWWFEDIPEDLTAESGEVVASLDEMLAYARVNDPWPVHLDPEAAAPFGGVIASFGYTVSLLFRLLHTLEVNRRTAAAFVTGLSWHAQFREPVRPGDRLRVRVGVLSKRLVGGGGRGIVTSLHTLMNHRGDEVVVIEMKAMFRAQPTSLVSASRTSTLS